MRNFDLLFQGAVGDLMEDILQKAVDRMLSEKAEFCDARFQTLRRLQINIVDGGVRSLTEDNTSGVCLRARNHGSWGYASTTSLEQGAVLEAASKAASIARLGKAKGKRIPELKAVRGHFRAEVKINPSSVPLHEKLSLAKDLCEAQKVDNRIVNTNSTYIESYKSSMLLNSFSTCLRWEEMRGRLSCLSVASESARTEVYYDMHDGSGGFEMFKPLDINEMGALCGREAVKMLSARKCPSGEMTCISDPMISGLLAHEVMGHASEADEVVKGRSFLSGVVGREVASDLVTMVDDGTVPGAYGSIPFDDEGTKSSRTTIIEKGVYKGYIHSLETAADLGVAESGNGRAQDPHHRIFVRMTNTFFEEGDWSLEEMLEGVKLGVLTDKAISGMEDPVGGGFEAKALRGFLIENGEIKHMLKGFTLTGKALEILKTTDAVSKEVRLDGGTCGKGVEDYVPVSSGGPYCRSRLILGGG
ncbi:MAG: TldD/PmbA family protein [Methanomassiliicoccales archaeon]